MSLRIRDGQLWTTLQRPPRRLGHRRNIRLLNETSWPDLTPLLSSRETLRRLVVTGPVADISAVNEFTALEELSFSSCSGKGVLELAALPHLRDLGLDRREIDVDLAGGDALEFLWLARCDTRWAGFLGTLPRLEELTLIEPRTLPTRLPVSLRKLRIGLATKWPTGLRISGIEGLQELSLESVRGIEDLRSFSGAKHLRKLYVEDCDEFASLEGPGLAEDFEELLAGRSVRRRSQ